MILVWTWFDNEGDRCYTTVDHQEEWWLRLGSSSLQVQTHGCGKSPIYQPALLSGFGNHSCCFGTLCGDYLGANLVPRLLLYRRTPFGVTMRLHVTRPLYSTCLVLTSKQYLHIHHIINRIKWLQSFKININMLPVDQEALDVIDRPEKHGTWSLTSQPLLTLNSGHMWGYAFLNACNRNMSLCCWYCTLQRVFDLQVQHSCIINIKKENTVKQTIKCPRFQHKWEASFISCNIRYSSSIVSQRTGHSCINSHIYVKVLITSWLRFIPVPSRWGPGWHRHCYIGKCLCKIALLHKTKIFIYFP